MSPASLILIALSRAPSIIGEYGWDTALIGRSSGTVTLFPGGSSHSGNLLLPLCGSFYRVFNARINFLHIDLW